MIFMFDRAELEGANREKSKNYGMYPIIKLYCIFIYFVHLSGPEHKVIEAAMSIEDLYQKVILI